MVRALQWARENDFGPDDADRNLKLVERDGRRLIVVRRGHLPTDEEWERINEVNGVGREVA